ncbi:thymidylate synthase [Mesorhizobium sp. M1339]|uniref:thymidylate synthase n=1 Tax=Mesorhizobium sp. M1339 TaxID=2957086 RepID=UPI003337AB69
MFLKAQTLDDALATLISRLLKSGLRTVSGKGPARELSGVLVEIADPRARFSRTEGRGMLIAFLGEVCWYLSGSDHLEPIEYYIKEYRKYVDASRKAIRTRGAYGPRLFGGGDKSQMMALLATMRAKQGRSDTRQAVAQIFDRSDLHRGKDIPCTTSLQFLPRGRKLDLIATMRSNDVYRGFPSDVFAFTFFQELFARSLGLEVGSYRHFVGSLHLYDCDEGPARAYLGEGLPWGESMPAMPLGDPWQSVRWLLDAEASLRTNVPIRSDAEIDGYWQDLARVLTVKRLVVAKDLRGLVRVKKEMVSPVYNAFIRVKERSLESEITTKNRQPILPGLDTAKGRQGQ